MKTRINLFIIAIFTLFILVACGKKVDQDFEGASNEELDILNESDFPIVNENITLDFMVGQHPATNDNYNDLLILNEYEKMTNIDINWEMVPLDTLAEKRNLAFGGGTLPDAIYSGRLPETELIKYGGQGLLIPLNDLIDEYAPNFKKIMEEYPEVEESLTMPDGNIYSFPMMGDPEFISFRVGAKPFIHKNILDELGMDIPETLDDFYEFLKAVKETNDDVVPFGAPNIGSLYAYLRGSFGLANKGSSSGYLDLDPETDELRFYPISEEYKELLEYMHKLFSEELIEQNIFTIETTQFLDNLSQGKYGSTIWYGPAVTVGNAGNDYTGMPALEGPDGDKLWTTLYDAVFEHSFAITKENEYPAATVRWIDYFYGEEGLKFFYMGIEGETYEINEDGEPEYMDHIINSKDGLSFEEEAKKYLVFPGGGYPSIATKEYFAGAESSPQSLEAADRLRPNIVEDAWTRFKHTKEEIDQLSGFGTDIEKYVEEMLDKFITGNTPLTDWDKYVKEIEDMGLDDYMEIKQKALDRKEN